jgi:hypothetical protein
VPVQKPTIRRAVVVLFAVSAVLAVVLLRACSGDPAPEPSPTATATAVLAPTPTPTPSPTGPLAPLTGEVVSADAAARPALAVKIENTAKARPQAGLEVADLVFEELVEGGITRFFAVFQSDVPAQIGPIRSARLVDADLLPAFSGIFLYSGGRDDVEASIRGAATRLTEGDSGVYRQSGRRAPSNLFADGVPVYSEAMKRTPELTAPAPMFEFSTDVPAGACASCDGSAIDASMSNQVTSAWTYEIAAGLYRLAPNGTRQPTVSGDDVGAANVILMGVELGTGGCCDTAGSPYVTTRTTGSGRAVVLRDGQWFETVWSRASASDGWSFAIDGATMALKPGATWIHLIPSSRLPASPAAPTAP